MSLNRVWLDGDPPTKVATPSTLFWIIKILSTGVGETTSDYFIRQYEPVAVVMIAAVVFVLALAWQMTRKRYLVWPYWSAVVMVSVFGTMAADITHVVLGVPYAVSTVFFAIVLGATFAVWYGAEASLSVHSINNPRRETFYWIAIVTTFALGTATGDLTATTLGLGYLTSGLLFVSLFVATGVVWWVFRANTVACFWIAYILTRPVGASFADWMGVSVQRGGLNWGTGPVSIVLATAILVLVAVSSWVLSRSTA